jgi:hypothetical protein
MAHDLLLFVSDYYRDLFNSGAQQAVDLVVKNGLVVNLNQTFWMFAVHCTNSCALPGRQNHCFHEASCDV